MYCNLKKVVLIYNLYADRAYGRKIRDCFKKESVNEDVLNF